MGGSKGASSSQQQQPQTHSRASSSNKNKQTYQIHTMFHHCFENQQQAPLGSGDEFGMIVGASKLSAETPSFSSRQEPSKPGLSGWFTSGNRHSLNKSEDKPTSIVSSSLSSPPPHPTTPHKSLEDALSEGLQNLTMEARDKANFDLHGVAQEPIQETPELQAQSLQYFDECIDILKFDPHIPTEAYRTAESLSPDYVQQSFLRLKFLRFVDFDNIRAAAERYLRYFDFKQQIFGTDKLVKDIMFDDLSPADQAAFQKGYLQISQHRDRSDRPIVTFFPNLEDYDSLDQLGRIMFYFGMLALTEKEAETRGAVMLVYALGKVDLAKFVRKRNIQVLQRMDDALPHKSASFHFCFNDKLFHSAWRYVFDFTSDPEKRARCRCHVGTHQEVLYELMTFGIPHDAVPISEDGKIKTKLLLELLDMKQVIEARTSSMSAEVASTYVLFPSRKDVLFGKGRRLQSHPGNISLKHRVDDMLSSYESLNKQGKTEFADTVVDTVKANGGRFLSQDNGVWMETTDEIARSKVAQMFRNRRKILAKSSSNVPSTVASSRKSPIAEEFTGVTDSKRLRTQ